MTRSGRGERRFPGENEQMRPWKLDTKNSHIALPLRYYSNDRSKFDPRALPAVAPLPTPAESKEHSAVYIVERELKLLDFQLSNTANPSLGNSGVTSEMGRSRKYSVEQLLWKED
uniref:Uncharacterized protein n=2 Tax=Oryza TaxID=4527 RepID=A0A0D3ERY1_9ORYZ